MKKQLCVRKDGPAVNVIGLIKQLLIVLKRRTSIVFDLEEDFYLIMEEVLPIRSEEDGLLSIDWMHLLFAHVSALQAVHYEPRAEAFQDIIHLAASPVMTASDLAQFVMRIASMNMLKRLSASRKTWKENKRLREEVRQLLFLTIGTLLTFAHIRTHFAEKVSWYGHSECCRTIIVAICAGHEAGLFSEKEFNRWKEKIDYLQIMTCRVVHAFRTEIIQLQQPCHACTC